MKIIPLLACFVLLIACIASAAATDTTSTSDSTSSTEAAAAAAQVYVSGVELDPSVFYPGEPGTVTVHVKNAAGQAVTLGNPTLIDSSLNIYTKNSFQAKTNVGPGSTADFIFLVTVDAGQGRNTFFPIFSVSPTVGNSIHSSFKLVTDSQEIQASISGISDTFTVSNAGTVTLSIVNPREGALKNIMVSAGGPGLQVSPSKKFISALNASGSVDIPFEVTPAQASDLTFTISYQAGDTPHSVTVVQPIVLGDDKMAAVPIINNVAITNQGSSYDMTGDVTNAGISDAKGLVISVAQPAQGTGRYQEYAVGSLASDDSSSFELTFTTTDPSKVPVTIRWKDDNGNNYSTNKTISLQGDTASGASSGSSGYTGARSYSGSAANSDSFQGRSGQPPGGGNFLMGGSRGNGISAFYPLIAGAVILVAAIVLYVKRKPIRAKLAGMKLRGKEKQP